MKVLLYRTPVQIETNHPRHIYPPLHLVHLRNLMLRNRIRACLVDGWLRDIPKDFLPGKDEPLLIVAEMDQPASVSALEKLARIRNRGGQVFVILIGALPTWRSGEFLLPGSPIDLIITGDVSLGSSEVILEAAGGCDRWNSIRAAFPDRLCRPEDNSHSGSHIPVLGYLPERRRDYTFIYPVPLSRSLVTGYIRTSSGCPRKCVFCSQPIRKSYGDRYRTASLESVFGEIEEMKRGGMNFLSIEDDNFSVDSSRLEEFCRGLLDRRLNLFWTAQVRADDLSPSLIDLMHRSGCRFLQFGLESGNSSSLLSLGKTNDPSGFKESAVRAFMRARRNGIAACALLMLGIPGESERDFFETMKWIGGLKPDLIEFHFFTPYPGSLFHEALSEHEKKRLKTLYHHDFPRANYSGMRSGSLYKIRSLLYRRFYVSPAFLVRSSRYVYFYLKNPEVLIYLLRKCLPLFMSPL